MNVNAIKQTLRVIVPATIALFITACENPGEQQLSQNSVIYCSEGSPESFNPQLVTSGTTVDATANQIYDRLITFNQQDNSISPAIAKSWHVTRDGKMITFYLRKDVQFHSTEYFTPSRSLNADDVIFSFNRILHKEHPYHQVSGGKYPFFQSVGFSNIVDTIERINDHTIRFKLNEANSSFLANIATDYAVILSAEYGQKLQIANKKEQIDSLPIGTGPFKLKQYLSGSHIRYYKHPQYWQHKVNIDQLVFDITSNNTARLTKLLTAECDVIAYPIAQNEILKNSHLLLDEVTSFNIGYLGFNTRKAPFNDVKVRKAIAHAINKQGIIETIYQGLAEPASNILPPSSWAHYKDDTLATHYAKPLAKQLMNEAGYPEGFEMDIWAMPVQRAYNPNALTMAELIQADLNEIGIKVNIVSYEWSTFLKKVADGEHDTVLLGWSADHPDPDNFLTPLLSCASANTGSNRTFWCDQEYDSLLKLALKTTNVEQRKQFYTRAQQIISEQLPLFPIAHSKRFQARHSNITGKILSSFGGINFMDIGKNPPVDTQLNAVTTQ